MTGRKHSILKILSAAAMWALMLPRIAVGEFGVCPPYSKTFGPDDPVAEMEPQLPGPRAQKARAGALRARCYRRGPAQ